MSCGRFSNFRIFLFAFVMLVGACSGGKTYDENMLVKGCTAAIEAFLPDGHSISELNKVHSFEAEQGLIHVELQVREDDNVHSSLQKHSCIFVTESGSLGFGANVYINQVNVHSTVIGMDRGAVRGSAAARIKMSEAAAGAMR